MRKRKIGIDLRFMQNAIFKNRGIGRYAACLINAFSKLSAENENRFKYIGYNPGGLHPAISAKYIRSFSKIGLFQQHIQFPLNLLRSDIKLIHYLVHDHASLHTRQPFIVTVHDLIPIKFGEFNTYSGIKKYLYQKIVEKILKRAKAIIAISEATKSDIIECFDVDSEKISVIYHGIEDIYQPKDKNSASEMLAEKYGIEVPYFLYLGGFDRRKNVPQLVEMFARLKKQGLPHNLVCVGPIAPYQSFVDVVNTIARHKLYKDVFLTGFVPTDDLPLFYSSADLFLFPSVYEGFGFPVLEAMACGTPVFAFENSSVKEISSGAGALVEGFSEMSYKVLNVLNDPQQYNYLRQQGLAKARFFKWENTAKMTLEVYKTVL